MEAPSKHEDLWNLVFLLLLPMLLGGVGLASLTITAVLFASRKPVTA